MTKDTSGGAEGSASTDVKNALRSSYLNDGSAIVSRVLQEGGSQVS